MANTLLSRKSLLLACHLFVSMVSMSQVTEKWVVRQNGDPNSDDEANDLVVDYKGNIYVTGSGFEKINNDFTTIRYDAGSNTHWVKKYNGPGNGDDRALAIATDNKGYLYVTGYSTGNGTGTDLTTIKYDEGSNTKWVKRLNGAGNDNDRAIAITVDDEGNVYVTGYTTQVGTLFDYTTIKYDKDGNTKWVRYYNGPGNGNDIPSAIAVDHDGNVYITGYSIGIGTFYDYATIKYNADGVQQWVNRYNGAANVDDRSNALAVDHSGNVYITGFITTIANEEEGRLTDIATIKYNEAGTQQWVSLFNHKGHDEARALVLDAAGNLYITGFGGTAEEDPDNDYVTLKYNSAGLQQWASIFESPGSDQDAGASALVLDAAGNVYITGAISITQELDYATIKYNNNGIQQWLATYDGPGNDDDFARAIGLDKNGNIYITGRSENERFDFATIRYTPDGLQKWVKRYTGKAELKGSRDRANALALDKEGNIHVTGGITKDNTGYDYTTYKYNKNGSREWKKTYNGPGIGPDEANAIYTDAYGNVYITGRSDGNGTGEDYATIKYDKSGDTKWVRRYNGPSDLFDEATAIVVDKNGNVYVTGQSTGSGPLGDYATVKYDKDGNQKWVRRYAGSGDFIDRPTAIGVDPAGNVYVTGYSYGALNAYDYVTIKYDANGNELWVSTYDGPANWDDKPYAMVVDAAGNIYITGESYSSSVDNIIAYATIKYNTAGVQQWVTRYAFPGILSYNSSRDIAPDASGNIYVTGKSGLNITTIKYNAAGVQQWLANYNSGSVVADGIKLALDASGNVYVTGAGILDNFTPEDYVTMKYNTDGIQQWLIRYDGPGHGYDFPADIAVGANGNVYVTGRSDAESINSDYATIVYEQTSLITSAEIARQETNSAEIVELVPVKLQAWAFPNTFTQFTNLQWRGSNKPVSIVITDAMGRIVERRNGLSAAGGTLQVGHNFSSGIYYATLVQGAEKIVVKLMKN